MRFFVAKLSAAPAASTGAPFTSELRYIQYAALLLESPYVLTFVYRVYENTTGTVEGKKNGGGGEGTGAQGQIDVVWGLFKVSQLPAWNYI